MSINVFVSNKYLHMYKNMVILYTDNYIKKFMTNYIILGGGKMKSKYSNFIAKTAMFLALNIMFQILGRSIPLGPNNNFIIGPIVNAILFVSTIALGVSSGAIVGLLSPFGAILTGASIPLFLAPIIAIGNLLLVLTFNLLKKRKVISILTSAVIKCAFLYIAVSKMLSILNIPEKKTSMLLFIFGWPQFVTALIGGFIAILLFNKLKKQIKEEGVNQ